MTTRELIKRIKERRSWRAVSAIAIILLAGLLIEVISLTQYNYAHSLVKEELDYRVENELTLKSLRVKSMLKSSEKMVLNYLWPVQSNLNHPDRIPGIIKRVVSTNKDVMTCFVAFVPGYYPDKQQLFEPVAIRRGDSIFTTQIASASHDYTHREFYQEAVLEGTSMWSDPYMDTDASGKHVTTFAMPLTDKTGQTVGAFGIDLSTKGIIDTLNTRHNFPSTFFLLLTEDGHLISQPDSCHTSHTDVDMVVKMINDSTCERKLSSSGHSKIITFNDKENGKGYAYYAFMRGQPHWQVVMVCYDDEVFGKLMTMRRNMLLLMLGAFTLLGFIVYRVNQYVNRLHKSRLNKERTESELHIAQRIQSEMLPHTDISRTDIDVSGKQFTALEVGGDLYDYFIRDEKLFFCIGDVSGKGVPSSLVMAVVHSQFRAMAQHESNPTRIMSSINQTACEGNETNMFVTLFIGVLDLPTGRLRYCNAGHDAPILITDTLKQLPVKANLPIGVFEDTQYVLQEEDLPAQATLFLYTDGLTEASAPTGQLYGIKRVKDTARMCMAAEALSPVQLMDSMHSEVIAHSDGAEQSDDLTMLTLHYHRPTEQILFDQTLKLINDVSQVPELNNFVKSVAKRLNLDSSLTSQMTLAVEEAVVNVMSYAYPLGTQGEVIVIALATDRRLKFIISDKGKAFDPTRHDEADTTLSAEDRPIGGLGILLVQQLMDSINYERVEGKNVLTLTKEYNKQ